ncbi:MAG: porphobilinogen synthase [Clostridiaceae bacterium]|nr:porphobilinogen synthase [Clostridiaceae bacterium]
MIHRGRRLRRNSVLRSLVRENSLSVEDFIYPIFVIEGEDKKEPIPSMEGQFYYSIDRLNDEIKELVHLGINSVILFGLPDKKDELGSEAYSENGVVQRAVRRIKEEFKQVLVVTDVCLCEYTSHGHCGFFKEEKVNNDKTLELLGKIALSHAKAGADIIAPSDMMDGRVGFIRNVLDKEGFEDIAIMSYSVKFSSAFYGPFREAAKSTPQSGDRKSYQMDFCNGREAIKEASWDIEEGADIIMVKPAMSYLDIVYSLKERFNVPIAVYNVSGEYAMVKSAAKAGLIDEEKMIMETLYSMKRAGADIIITYFAKDAARIIRGEYHDNN